MNNLALTRPLVFLFPSFGKLVFFLAAAAAEMPISSEQWRMKTGMINSSRGFRQHSIKPPSLCEFPLTPPPSDWKGYSLALH